VRVAAMRDDMVNAGADWVDQAPVGEHWRMDTPHQGPQLGQCRCRVFPGLGDEVRATLSGPAAPTEAAGWLRCRVRWCSGWGS
jgi:hypothetical protein